MFTSNDIINLSLEVSWLIKPLHLVRYEKMERSYLGLLMLAASVIVLRKIKRKDQGNIIYG